MSSYEQNDVELMEFSGKRPAVRFKGEKVSFGQSSINAAAASTLSRHPLSPRQLHRTTTVHTHSETNALQRQPELAARLSLALPPRQLHSNPQRGELAPRGQR